MFFLNTLVLILLLELSINTSRKLPYIGKFSVIAKNKMRKLCERYCNSDVDIKLIFVSFKIGSVFSTKDMIPEDLKSNVVYKFNCARCNSCYIGETTRHISTRIKEHLKTDKASHVYKHLNSNSECKEVCNVTCFSILDTAHNNVPTENKGGYVYWVGRTLTQQTSKTLKFHFVSLINVFKIFICYF